jgi:hypothetical protein
MMKVLACSKVRMVPVLGYHVVELAVKRSKEHVFVLWALKEFLDSVIGILECSCL